jgi:protein-S-isoprenylcysteine O-methyltransferase Ste14
MSPDTESNNSSSDPPSSFGLTGLILSVVALAVLIFVGVSMFRRFNRPPEGIAVLYPIFAPMALMVALGIVYSAMRLCSAWWRRRARRLARHLVRAEAVDEAG